MVGFWIQPLHRNLYEISVLDSDMSRISGENTLDHPSDERTHFPNAVPSEPCDMLETILSSDAYQVAISQVEVFGLT